MEGAVGHLVVSVTDLYQTDAIKPYVFTHFADGRMNHREICTRPVVVSQAANGRDNLMTASDSLLKTIVLCMHPLEYHRMPTHETDFMLFMQYETLHHTVCPPSPSA